MTADDPIGIWEAPALFRDLTLGHFAFLLEELGFRVVDDSATPFVVFASDTEVVSVYYNAEWHHELGVSLRSPADPKGSSESVDMLLRAAGLPADTADDFAIQMPSTGRELDSALARRAAQVRRLLQLQGS